MGCVDVVPIHSTNEGEVKWKRSFNFNRAVARGPTARFLYGSVDMLCFGSSRGSFIFITLALSRRMASLIKTIKDKFTPHLLREVHRQGTTLTLVWVTGLFLILGLVLALVCLYSRVMTLEQAITVLGAR